MDRVTVFNGPKDLAREAEGAVRAGLEILRKEAGIKDDFSVLIFFKPDKGVFTVGECIGEREVVVAIDPVNFRKKSPLTRRTDLASTVVHEAVHSLRYGKKIKTILDALLNEGISCFVQTELVSPPEYLDFKNTRTDDIRKWWKWWRNGYFKLKVDKDKGFWDSVPQRTAAYRIGFHIVSGYWDATPGLTLPKLMNTDFKTLSRFADKFMK